MGTLVYSHPACFDHRPGRDHPESPARLAVVLQALRTPAFAALQWRDAPLATKEQLLLAHDPAFVEAVFAHAPAQGCIRLDAGDTRMSPGSLQAALRSVGAACAGVDAVMRGEARNVFCATRPCGHHAEPARAMGFCVFNQAAIAAAHALQAHGLQRVAVVDFDVHHGNGTQAICAPRPQLFYASSHQWPFYPGTGARDDHGQHHNVVNVPLPGGCDSALFRARIAAEMLPALRRFEPQLLIVSAGFDAHALDPLADLALQDDDFGWITGALTTIASEVADGRLVSVLEGGYSLEGLAGGAAAHVRALMHG